MNRQSSLLVYDMISCCEDSEDLATVDSSNGWLLVTSYDEWQITQSVFELGDPNVASLLFGEDITIVWILTQYLKYEQQFEFAALATSGRLL